MAGRGVVTGHDADFHCSLSSHETESSIRDQCGFVKKVVDYIRGGSANPNLPVLVLDKGGDTLTADGFEGGDVPKALDKAFGFHVVPREVFDPISEQWRTVPLDPTRYSGIIVASDYACGGCDLNAPNPDGTPSTADSDAINARSADILRFFNGGGGVLAFAGDIHGNGDASDGPDSFYNFMPVGVGGKQVTSPFSLTASGRAFGFVDPCNGAVCPDSDAEQRSDINCCATHNSFDRPSLGSWVVLERNANGFPQTMATDGTATSGGVISRNVAPPVFGASAAVNRVKGTVLAKEPGDPNFGPLVGAANVGVGTEFDTRRGTMRVTTQVGAGSTRTQSANVNGGTFKITQPTRGAQKGITNLEMTGRTSSRCPGGSRGAGAKASRRGKAQRRLFGNGKGKFRTRGKYAAATVRGTKWEVTDYCDGTLVKARTGSVTVEDLVTKRKTTLRRGKSVFIFSKAFRGRR